jgi:serine/threonine-protein kinase
VALTPGSSIGSYQIAAQIGAGGMGEVYRATDTKLKRDVAIKVLPEAVAGDADRLARFQREAQVLAALNHPGIAHIYGVEDAPASTSGQPLKALVMELVEGPTLADRVAEGPLPVEDALPIARQIAEALEAAHEQGIIHRDLKPANIKVRPDGTVKVLDFGLAKAVEPAGAIPQGLSLSPTLTTPAMTQAGLILGTAAYMSPEQAKGRVTDRRTDIWAFGCVLFEMLTARPAFEGEDVSETLASVIKGTTSLEALPPEIPTSLRRLLRRCLQKDTRQRFQDVGDVRYELEHLTDESASVPLPLPAVEPASRRGSFLPWVAGVGLAAVVGIGMWMTRPAPSPGPVVRLEHALPADRAVVASTRPVLGVAPDGSGFVYQVGGGLEFRAMDSFDTRPVAGVSSGIVQPVFSPDGAWIGYVTAGRIMKVPVTGGTALEMTSAGVANLLGWSWGENDRIYYASPDGIRVASPNGGNAELLIESESSVQFAEPRLLPGGEWLLYSIDSPGNWDAAQIVAQSLLSGERRVLWNGGSAATYVSTGHLVYAQGNTLFALPMELASMTTSGGPVPVVEGLQRTVGSDHSANYGITREGTLLYLADTGAQAASRLLALVDRSGRVSYLDVPPRMYLSPRMSPDGDRLAVQTDEPDGTSQIWTYALSGETAMAQLTLEGNNFRPTWTRDGERIAFASDRDGTTSIYWQAADGRGVAERLTTAEEGIAHWPDSWSGTTLAFRRESIVGGAANNVANEMDIWAVSVDGTTPGDPEPIRVEPVVQENGASFSPDSA